MTFLTACTPLGPKIDEEVSDNHYYSVFRMNVIFGQNGNCFEAGCFEIEEADTGTFRPLNDLYAVDRQRVYYREDVILGETADAFRLAGGPYAVGAEGVYWYGETFPVEDRASFHAGEFLIDEWTHYYGVDRSGVYCENEKISNSPESFHALEREKYFADNGDVYYMDGKDSTSVYVLHVQNRRMDGADSETFEALCTGIGPPHYARDKSHVYDFGEIVEGVHPSTFDVEANCG